MFSLTSNRRFQRLTMFLKLMPVILVAVVAIIGASQLNVVKEFLADATGEPANLVIDVQASLGPINKTWQNLAQGGEMSDWSLTPIKGQVAALQPQYIRLDHLYSFYDIVQKNGDQLSFDFSKIDPLITEILATGAKPYLSLSYMPAPISADGQIVSQPTNWADWQATVRATILHFSKDRGINDVIYEVWNEPDLFGSWKTYGDKNYLTLYDYAARGALQARAAGAKPFKFGGPAVTANYKNWFTGLAKYAANNNLPLDFYSWHRYNKDVDQFRDDLATVRQWQAETPEAANLELHITEWGHDSENHFGYDTNYGAAHTVAVASEMPSYINRAFLFEIEDGKDPAGQTYWGRWGLLTNRASGNLIKPRYQAVRFLNQLEGEQILVLGKGTWVKAIAAKQTFPDTAAPDKLRLLVVNYDQYAKHTEDVPITFRNVIPGKYSLKITNLDGTSRILEYDTSVTQTTELTTNLLMGPNSVTMLELTVQR